MIQMNNTRRIREPANTERTKPEYGDGISEPSPKRALSVDVVMDDMRAILWPDRCDQKLPDEGELVSALACGKTGARFPCPSDPKRKSRRMTNDESVG
jgi:hypothetical protein